MRKTAQILIAIAFIIGFFSTYAHAQFSVGVAEYYPIDEPVENGDIISFHGNQYEKSSRRFDQNVVGVVSENSAVELRPNAGADGYYPVVATGVVFAKVSTLTGPIASGDLLVTSEIPGVAIKLIEGEGANPMGIAQQSYEEADPAKIGLIQVQLFRKASSYTDTNPYQENILTAILGKLSIENLQRYETPSQLLRVFLAAVIIILSFILGFVTFRKIAGHGVEALGRNPMAGRMIFLHLVLDVLFTAFIILVGILLGYFILTF